MIKNILIGSFLLLATASLSFAQSKAPIEVTADGAISWNKEKQYYQASDNAKVIQSGSEITAETITAYYNENDSRSLTEIIANGGVMMRNGDYTAHGEEAVYDPKQEILILTGKGLMVKATGFTVTAEEKIVYNRPALNAKAFGNVTVDDAQNQLTSETMTVFFKENTQKSAEIDRIVAEGGVVINTGEETITGEQATYDPVKDQAEITGNVEIRRADKTRLNGSRAFLNMKTGVSQLTAGSPRDNDNGSGQVRALFYTE